MYYRNSPYNFIVQQFNVHALHLTVDLAKPLTEHIKRYESKYAKMLNLMKNSQDAFYSQEYFNVLVQDQAKKNLLLSALSSYNPLLVDNLMSNHALSYEDSKNHLCILSSSQWNEGFNLVHPV